jgi:hypothetical protein
MRRKAREGKMMGGGRLDWRRQKIGRKVKAWQRRGMLTL